MSLLLQQRLITTCNVAPGLNRPRRIFFSAPYFLYYLILSLWLSSFRWEVIRGRGGGKTCERYRVKVEEDFYLTLVVYEPKRWLRQALRQNVSLFYSEINLFLVRKRHNQKNYKEQRHFLLYIYFFRERKSFDFFFFFLLNWEMHLHFVFLIKEYFIHAYTVFLYLIKSFQRYPFIPLYICINV